jgi:hypothetical protein
MELDQPVGAETKTGAFWFGPELGVHFKVGEKKNNRRRVPFGFFSKGSDIGLVVSSLGFNIKGNVFYRGK